MVMLRAGFPQVCLHLTVTHPKSGENIVRLASLMAE